MRLLCLIALVLSLFAAPDKAAANGRFGADDVRMERVGADSSVVVPGEVVTLVFRSTSTRPDSLTLSVILDLPTGWRSVRPTQELILAPGKPTVRFLSILIPETARAGSYSLGVHLSTPGSKEHLSSLQAAISVLPVHGLEFDVTPAASFVAAGQSVDVAIQATNRGNAPIDVIWAADPTDSGHFKLGARRTALEPGETATVHGTFTSDADLRATASASIRVLGRIDNVDDSNSSGTATIDVIPAYERIKPRGNPIPLGLTLETAGNEETARPSARVRSEIPVAGGNLSIQATLAGREEHSVYAPRNDVRVTYETSDVTVTAGDHTQNLSPLTTRSETGFGVSAEVRKSDWTVKTTAAQNRHGRPDEVRTGFSVRKSLTDASTLSTNLLVRNGYYTGSVGTFRFENKPGHGRHSMDLECGISGTAAFTDPSCSLNATWRNSLTSVRTQAMRTSADYPGAGSAVSMLSENVSLRLGRHVRLDESVQWLSRSFADGIGRTDVSVRAGGTLAFRVASGSLISTIHGVREDSRYETGGFSQNTSSSYARTSVGYQLPRMGLTINAERGFREASTAERTPLRRLRGQFRVQPFKILSLSLTAERSRASVAATGMEQRYRQWGVNSSLALPNSFQIAGGVFNNQVDTPGGTQEYESVSGRIVKRFNSGSELLFQMQANRSRGRTEIQSADYRLAYSMPLLIPGRPSGDSQGLVTGFIYEKATGKPIPGVLVRFGDQIAISNAEGRFLVAPNPSGESFLFVNATTLPQGLVPEQVMPMSIGLADQIDIPVVAASSLRGSVRHYRRTDDESGLIGLTSDDLTASDGIHSVLLKLSSGNGSYRTRSDAFGAFAFEGVPAGTYTIQIVRNGSLESGFTFVSDSMTVSLSPGDRTSVELKATPVKKRIRFLSSGNVVSSNSGKTAVISPHVPEAVGIKNGNRAIPSAVETPKTPERPEPRPTTSKTPANWIRLLQDTANAPNDDQEGGIPPLLLGSPPVTPPSPPSGLLVLILALSGLFVLLDIDLIAQNLLRRRRAASGILGALHESSGLWRVRQVVLYTVTIGMATGLYGVLAGISAAMGLFSITLAVELWDSIHSMAVFVRLYMVQRSSLGGVMIYHGMPVVSCRTGLFETRIELLSGDKRTIPTSSLTGPSVSLSVAAQWIDTTVTTDRSTNLHALRVAIEAAIPALSSAALRVEYEDVDHRRTTVRIRALIALESDRDVIMHRVASCIPTTAPTHLRLVSSHERAA